MHLPPGYWLENIHAMRTGGRSQSPFAVSFRLLPSSRSLLFSSAHWGCFVLIWNFLARPLQASCPLQDLAWLHVFFWWVETWKSFNYLTHHGNLGSTLGTSDIPNYDDIWFHHTSSHIFMEKKKRLSGILEALLQKTETQCLIFYFSMICAYRWRTKF